MSTRKKRSIFDIIDEYFERLDEWAERFGEVMIERPSWNQRASTIEPLRDILITPNEVIVTADLPYAEESKVQVKPLDEDSLEIIAKMRRKVRFADFGITHHAGEFQTFRCQTRIPVPVDMRKMEVHIKKGILEIHLPRKGRYRIPIE
ncbi:Hsp20/alpha crystallin family protein [Candidatus Bathyarchaeota archaeon]|nr:Hsp20/alpha crystallin family protein [Candidatus Bathyarchaeota archaeon]